MTRVMTVLAFDTACSACSAALWADGAIVASRTLPMNRGHAEALLPMILDIMSTASIAFSDLGVVAVTLGPGSFTGLRTGLATAKGIALAHDLPLVGVNTLEAVALAAQRSTPPENDQPTVTVVLENRRGGVYLQSFGADLTPLGEPCSASMEEVPDILPKNGTLLAGDAARRIVSALSDTLGQRGISLVETVTEPDAVFVAELAARRLAEGTGNIKARGLTPLYIQAPEAKRPIAGGRLRS
jgi:tRNA threonylcarbamoyladenosine biosynthesis protein TsaB